MKFLLLSDTHNSEPHINIINALDFDVLLHAGDLTNSGEPSQVRSVVEWFSLVKTPVIFIAGNHDFYFEDIDHGPVDLLVQQARKETWNKFKKALPPNTIYLNNEEYILNLNGEVFKIYGSPWQPWFYDWAFNLPELDSQNDYAGAKAEWAKIPLDTNILITHGPPQDILDLTLRGVSCGCPILMKTIDQMPNLRLHVFGHIHEAKGVWQEVFNGKQRTFVNASFLNLNYSRTNEVVIWDSNDDTYAVHKI